MEAAAPPTFVKSSGSQKPTGAWTPSPLSAKLAVAHVAQPCPCICFCFLASERSSNSSMQSITSCLMSWLVRTFSSSRLQVFTAGASFSFRPRGCCWRVLRLHSRLGLGLLLRGLLLRSSPRAGLVGGGVVVPRSGRPLAASIPGGGGTAWTLLTSGKFLTSGIFLAGTAPCLSAAVVVLPGTSPCFSAIGLVSGCPSLSAIDCLVVLSGTAASIGAACVFGGFVCHILSSVLHCAANSSVHLVW